MLELVPGKVLKGKSPYLRSADAEIRVTGSLQHEIRTQYTTFQETLSEPVEVWLENFSKGNGFYWEIDLTRMMHREVIVKSLSDDELPRLMNDVIEHFESAIRQHPSFFLIGLFKMRPDSTVEVVFRVSRAPRWPAIETCVRSSGATWN